MIDKRGNSVRGEPERDPRLARAIREVEGASASVARLELLRSRIVAAAMCVLDARRERAWWEWMTGWARTEVALAAAATILAAVIAGGTTVGRGDFAADSAVAVTTILRETAAPLDSVVSGALAAGASSEQVMNALVGPANGEWLLTAAVMR